MCRLGQGEAREWSAVARRSHRGADRADIVFRFRSSLALPKMEVAIPVMIQPQSSMCVEPEAWAPLNTSARSLSLRWAHWAIMPDFAGK